MDSVVWSNLAPDETGHRGQGSGGMSVEDGRAENVGAAGGNGALYTNSGRDGGSGSARSMSAAGQGMSNTSGDGGGGGGGGGHGYIVVWTPSATDFDIKAGAVITPRETLVTGVEARP